MSASIASLLVSIGMGATFLSGMYDVYHHSPTNLFQEITTYIFASIFTLIPFYLLFRLHSKVKNSEFVVSIGGLLMGGVGSCIYLGEAFSRDPSWGFSIIIAPIAQYLFYLVLRIFL